MTAGRRVLVVALAVALTLAAAGAALAATGEVTPQLCIDDNDPPRGRHLRRGRPTASAASSLPSRAPTGARCTRPRSPTTPSPSSRAARRERSSRAAAPTTTTRRSTRARRRPTGSTARSRSRSAPTAAPSTSPRSTTTRSCASTATRAPARSPRRTASTTTTPARARRLRPDGRRPRRRRLGRRQPRRRARSTRRRWTTTRSCASTATPRPGALTPQGCIDDNDSGADDCAQATDGLDGARSVAVSPDGDSVYVASGPDDALVALLARSAVGAPHARRAASTTTTAAPDTCAQTADGLDGARAVVVSPDGESVYVALADRRRGRALRPRPGERRARRRRAASTTTTAAPTPARETRRRPRRRLLARASAPTGSRCTWPRSTTTPSPRFDRDPDDGALTSQGCIDDNDAPDGPDDCARSADGLNGAIGVTSSAGTTSLYVLSVYDEAVAVARAPGRGPARDDDHPRPEPEDEEAPRELRVRLQRAVLDLRVQARQARLQAVSVAARLRQEPARPGKHTLPRPRPRRARQHRPDPGAGEVEGARLERPGLVD